MKHSSTTYYLTVLSILLLSTVIYGQLPSDHFTAYSGNPVIPRSPGKWDSRAVWCPNVTYINDTFYVFYNGSNDLDTTPVAIGLATSTDGYNFTKFGEDPVLSGDGVGFDAYATEHGLLVFNNSQWYLYYSGRSSGPNFPGNMIGRAVSNEGPCGPWIRSDDTLLATGSPGEWDSEIIGPEAILVNGPELIMYYWAAETWPSNNPKIGRATSTDNGLTWIKYNDETTNYHPYLESDPVLVPDRPYDINGIWGCTVFKLDTAFEMYYSGSGSGNSYICYATSMDGIVWIKDDLYNPIFTVDSLSIGVLEKPSIVKTDSIYFMYYDYGIGMYSSGVGLATAYVPSITMDPENLDFGSVAVDSSSTMIFTITNSGYADLEITNITSNEPAFTVNTTSAIIPPAESLDIEVDFTPTREGAFDGIIEITHNAVGNPDSVVVTGNGTVTGIEENLLTTAPNNFIIYQNYPNPFNPKTSLIFGLPEAGKVKLLLFNSLGEEVTILFEGYKTAGYYQIEFDAKNLPSGVYFYRLQAENFVETKKMLLLK